MSNTVVQISSDNFSGQSVNVIFTPSDNSNVYSLGQRQIPFTFTSTTISNSLEVYGTYTIVTSANCITFLYVPNPTSTPTPTPSITPTLTPTLTPTVTPTPSYDPCKVPSSTPTPTLTTTPTVTPSVTPSVTPTIDPCLYTYTPTPTLTTTPTPTINQYPNICFNYNSSGVTYNELLTQQGLLNGKPYYQLTIGFVWAGVTGVWYWSKLLGSGVYANLTNGSNYPDNTTTSWSNLNTNQDEMYSSNYEVCVPTPTPTSTPTLTPTPTNTVTPTSTITPTITPTNTVTPSITPTNTVTPTNTTTPTPTPSPVISLGGSLSFDGVSGQYLSIPVNSNFDVGTNDFTFEWFANIPSQSISSIDSRIFEFGTYPSRLGVSFEGSNPTLIKVWVNSQLGFQTSLPVSIPTGWYHYALVRNGSLISLYYDGYLLTSSSSFGSPILNNGYSLEIGIDTTYSSTTQFLGNLTNIRFVNGTAVYSGPTYTVPTSQLTSVPNTVLLLLADTAPTYLVDSSPLSNTISNINGVTWSSSEPF